MTKRSEILARLPVVFGLNEAEAATAVGMSATMFRQLVEEGVMPRPRIARGRRIYEVDELHAALKAMPTDHEKRPTENEWDSVHAA